MTHSVSRTAKPIAHYISNEPIAALACACGDYLEKLTAQQKCLLGAVIYDHMASHHATYTIVESLGCIDPDNLLGDRLWDYIKSIADNSDASELARLHCALGAFVVDDADNGAFD